MRTLLIAVFLVVAVNVVFAGDPPTPAQIQAWERQLTAHDTEPEARTAIRRKLAELEPPSLAVVLVRRLLGAASPQLRIEGARVAVLLGEHGRPLTRSLLENLRDPGTGVRGAAAEALGQVADPALRARVLERLARALDDEQASVRASALMGLVALDGLSGDTVLDRLLAPNTGAATIGALLDRRDESGPTVAALLLAESRNLRELVLRMMCLRINALKKTAPLKRLVTAREITIHARTYHHHDTSTLRLFDVADLGLAIEPDRLDEWIRAAVDQGRASARRTWRPWTTPTPGESPRPSRLPPGPFGDSTTSLVSRSRWMAGCSRPGSSRTELPVC